MLFDMRRADTSISSMVCVCVDVVSTSVFAIQGIVMYKANNPVRVVRIFLFTLCGMNNLNLAQLFFLEKAGPLSISHSFAGLLTRSIRRPSRYNIISGKEIRRTINEHTAAGLFGILTRFPFHPIAPDGSYGTKLR